MKTRAQWGARPPRSREAAPLATGVAVHWEGGRLGAYGHEQCSWRVRQIQNFHMDTRGWADIAYNFLVCQHGEVYEGRGTGIRNAASGTNYANANYLAVCYIGGEGDPFTTPGKAGVRWVINTAAGRDIKPHSNFQQTQCPGDEIRAWIRAGCPVPAKSGGFLMALSDTDQVALLQKVTNLEAWFTIPPDGADSAVQRQIRKAIQEETAAIVIKTIAELDAQGFLRK